MSRATARKEKSGMSIEGILAPVNLVLLMVLLILMVRNGRKKK